jgi:hypothetical protein
MDKPVNLEKVISNFKVIADGTYVRPFGSGHINDSYLLLGEDHDIPLYLLQKINHHIFKNIDQLIRNIWLVTNHLRAKYKALGYPHIESRVLRLVPCVDGTFYCKDEEGQYWRMYHYIEGTKTYDIVSTEKQAYEGGKAFGRFQALLSDLPSELIYATIPDFLNMEKRLEVFEAAIAADREGRAYAVSEQISFLRHRAQEMCYFQQPENIQRLPLRITHNDTKV